jgi:xanthine dehydrogenase small subunit
LAFSLTVNGDLIEVADERASLLDVLRTQVGFRSVKDGCSPQGQCGCCTVLVDGAPRVACVTPARRVAGRTVTTLEGLPEAEREAWVEAFTATGASQCGFCTPGIIVRLEALRTRSGAAQLGDDAVQSKALAAHLCRCTGWQPIREACALRAGGVSPPGDVRDLTAASARATIEGRSPQVVDPAVARGGSEAIAEHAFADDAAPHDALVAVPDGFGGWVVAETLAEARARAGKVQGRRTTVEAVPPLEVPPPPAGDDWAVTLRTSWVEPAYLETDASWCRPGGEPASPLANGGAFGGKRDSIVGAVARRLADEHGRAVRIVLSREDAVRFGDKRPPLAAGLQADGSGVVRVVRTPGIVTAIRRVAPDVVVDEVDVPGPPTSASLRGAGWVELIALQHALRSASGSTGPVTVQSPDGAVAAVTAADDGRITVELSCGEVLDEVVLRSYAIGAVHQALGLVTSEALAVDAAGTVHDLTIRSFGILRAADMPRVDVRVDRTARGAPVNGSDAVFAAAVAAVWLRQGRPPAWPTRLPWPPQPD